MEKARGREEILRYLEAELIGPVKGPQELLAETPPTRRYSMGVLYPQSAKVDNAIDDEEKDETGGSVGEDISDDPIAMSGQFMPSSIGLTFFFDGAKELEVDVEGAAYEKIEEEVKGWQRIPIADRSSPEILRISQPDEGSTYEEQVLNDRGRVHTQWRKLGEGHLVTVTLLNAREHIAESKPDAKDCLFQVGLRCRVPDGSILEYPDAGGVDLTEKEEEMRILYRSSKTYAIGHGCAADWDVEDDEIQSVRTDVMPRHEVHPIKHTSTGDPDILKISRLADASLTKEELVGELGEFTSRYEEWIAHLPEEHTDIPEALLGARDRLVGRLEEATKRMRRGIQLLKEDQVVRQAFRLANRAMLMQMYRGQKYGKRRKRDSFEIANPDYSELDGYTWYPFQLAYQLVGLHSVVDPESEYRDVVDLIWFPTGGGKTEAYLAVAAFQIFLRRLKSGNQGAGTAVITRYTLRLLTAQQFERSARLICACEMIRQQYPERMGDTPITIGLWVGTSMSPNRYSGSSEYPGALEIYEKLLEDPSPGNPFQLEQCPWCGTEIIPADRVEDEEAYGVRVGNRSFEMYCPSEECSFHSKLPVSVVDKDLYSNPPSFLIATVDKFARLAWVGEAGAFFGTSEFDPPSLIIQDELHLLSGPLGTTTGIYESAIESLMEMKGIEPKVIASTATIRSAKDQVSGLFGNDVRLFPPPGLSSDNSYFAKTDYSEPGRLYVGVLSSNHRPTYSLVLTTAALQQAPKDCSLTEAERDAYWTLVAYHNSLRELGKTVTLARDDIPARIRVIADDDSNARDLDSFGVLEMTSNLSDEKIPKVFSRLKRGPDEEETVSIAACTSMFSVGVDIDRLGLMVVNGQPKTTSEYIQASSRVGRGEVPGLVVMHYAANKSRDRSHYESFKPYHSRLYRNVEPTSVTPFSLPARERALHAALVILVRHGVGLTGNEDANRFDRDDPEVRHAMSLLEDAVNRMEPEEADSTVQQLQNLADEWHHRAQNHPSTLYYATNTRSRETLLRNFGQSREGWPTLHSMRNVDRQCEIEVIGE